MARFAIGGNKGASSVQSILLVNAAAASPRRIKLYDYSVGSGATPADSAFIHILQRSTTAGTGAALTPNATDPADTLASTAVCKDTVTADPTLTAAAFLGRRGLNQKATYRWMAAYPGAELVIPATANAGIMIGLSAASTTTFDADAHYEEQ